MLQGVWQALNCLSIHASGFLSCSLSGPCGAFCYLGHFKKLRIIIIITYCVIVAGASPGETKMWAAVRKNGDFLTVVNYTIFAAIIDSFMSN